MEQNIQTTKSDILKKIIITMKLKDYKQLSEEEFNTKLPFYLDEHSARIHLKTPFIDNAVIIDPRIEFYVGKSTDFTEIIIDTFEKLCLIGICGTYSFLKHPVVMGTSILLDIPAKALNGSYIFETGAVINYFQDLEQVKMGGKYKDKFRAKVILDINSSYITPREYERDSLRHYELMKEVWNGMLERGYIPINRNIIELKDKKHKEYCISSLNSVLNDLKLLPVN